MPQNARRFELVLEPTDRWMVWDRLRDVPAEFAGKPLIGLNRIVACAALSTMSEFQKEPVMQDNNDVKRWPKSG